MEKIDALALIRREMKHKQLSTADVAQKLNFGVTSTYSIFRRKYISVQHLADFSEVLQYNFFNEIGSKFSLPEPANEEVSALQERVKELELEVSFLRRTIKDMMGK